MFSSALVENNLFLRDVSMTTFGEILASCASN